MDGREPPALVDYALVCEACGEILGVFVGDDSYAELPDACPRCPGSRIVRAPAPP